MSWVDIVIVVLAIAGLAIQSKRGFLQSVFDLIACILAIIGARVLAPMIPSLSPGVSFAVVGGVVFALLLIVSRLCYASIGLTIETLDPVLGGFFGVLLALSIGYGLASGLAVANEGKMPDSVGNSKIAYQLVTMEAAKSASNMVFGGPDSDSGGGDAGSSDDAEDGESDED